MNGTMLLHLHVVPVLYPVVVMTLMLYVGWYPNISLFCDDTRVPHLIFVPEHLNTHAGAEG